MSNSQGTTAKYKDNTYWGMEGKNEEYEDCIRKVVKGKEKKWKKKTD